MFIKDFMGNVFRMADEGGSGGSGSSGAGAVGGGSAAAGGQGAGDGSDGGQSGSGSQSGQGGDQNGDKGSGGQGTGAGDKKETILGDAKKGTGADDKAASTPADWPADWRQKGITAAGVADADKPKVLAMLERLGSPGDLVKKVIEQEKLIAQTRKGGTLAKDATPEQVAQYRKDNGIPETAEGYDLTNLPNGITVGEQDKPIVAALLGTMHTNNMTPAQVRDLMTSYYQQEAQFLRDREEKIAANKTEQEDALRRDWGDEFRSNVNVISNLSNTWSQATQEALAGALDSNGFPLLNNKDFLKDMAVIARTINPIDTVPSSGAGNTMNGVTERIAEIEKRMVDDRDGYFKDEKMQDEYRKLLDFRERNTQKK